MFRRRVHSVFVLLVLLIIQGCATVPPSVNSDTSDSVAPVPDLLILSGQAGVAGVTFAGMSNTVTDSNGVFSTKVPYGWSGTLIPEKEGYTFEPEHRRYDNIKRGKPHQDFLAKPILYTLAGSIGIDGVKLTGLPGSPQTGQNGCYSVDLGYGWSGTVIPQKEGWEFTPESMHYAGITQDRLHEDYQSRPLQHPISGTVGLAGVHMTGLPDRVVTDEKGQYLAMVPHGWSGRVIPKRSDVDFEPIYRDYNDVNSGYELEDYRVEIQNEAGAANGDYRDEVLTLYTLQPLPETKRDLTISGQFVVQGKSVEGLTVEASNGGTRSRTDADGRFALTVPYGWSGELSVRKPGLYIYPSTWQYTNLTRSLRLQTQKQTVDQNTSDTVSSSVDTELSPAESNSSELIRASHREESLPLTPPLISTTKLTPEVYAELEQDLSVMAAILEKAVYGVSLVRQDRAGHIQALYLEDQCALFTIPIEWRLAKLESTDKTASLAAAGMEEANLWEQTRREILDSEHTDDVVERLGHKKTLQFKQQLIDALRYATNIRHLSKDHWIALFVWSRQSSERLVLRVQKEAVDQYAQGQYTPDEFAEHVHLWTY